MVVLLVQKIPLGLLLGVGASHAVRISTYTVYIFRTSAGNDYFLLLGGILGTRLELGSIPSLFLKVRSSEETIISVGNEWNNQIKIIKNTTTSNLAMFHQPYFHSHPYGFKNTTNPTWQCFMILGQSHHQPAIFPTKLSQTLRFVSLGFPQAFSSINSTSMV